MMSLLVMTEEGGAGAGGWPGCCCCITPRPPLAALRILAAIASNPFPSFCSTPTSSRVRCVAVLHPSPSLPFGAVVNASAR
jgi:hypothetical protein